jgi:hypothetical protein
MGSKNLKAVAIRGTNGVSTIRDPKAFMAATVAAKKELQKRAKEESAAMKVILQRLLDSIKKGLASKDINQLELVFNEAEMKQLRSNQNYWKTRISDIEADLEDEPKRVASFYNVTSVQLQPVGLAYLWPKSS